VIASDGPEPAQTVPGDPQVVDELASRLLRFAQQAGEAAGQLDHLDSAHWSGSAAERFRTAVQHVPDHLTRSHDAFASAQSVLRRYAGVLRDGQSSAGYAQQLIEAANAATQGWEADGSVGPDPGTDDREQAARLLLQARERVDMAGRSAAARIRDIAASAPPPSSQALSGRTPGLHTDGMTVRAATEHPLRDPDGFVDGAGQHTTALRYGAAHHVGFADGTNGSASWESWIGVGESRGTGQVTVELLAALGLGVLGVAAAKRRRSRAGRTAMAAAGADPATLAAGRPARSGAIGGVSARLHGGRMRTPAAWRTNLAHGTAVRAGWPAAAPAGRSTADAPVVLDSAAAIRHRGAPGSVVGD
jgi:hypothetical protein